MTRICGLLTNRKLFDGFGQKLGARGKSINSRFLDTGHIKEEIPPRMVINHRE